MSESTDYIPTWIGSVVDTRDISINGLESGETPLKDSPVSVVSDGEPGSRSASPFDPTGGPVGASADTERHHGLLAPLREAAPEGSKGPLILAAAVVGGLIVGTLGFMALGNGDDSDGTVAAPTTDAEVANGDLETSAEIADGELETSAEIADGELETSGELDDGELETSAEIADGELETSAEIADGELETSGELDDRLAPGQGEADAATGPDLELTATTIELFRREAEARSRDSFGIFAGGKLHLLGVWPSRQTVESVAARAAVLVGDQNVSIEAEFATETADPDGHAVSPVLFFDQPLTFAEGESIDPSAEFILESAGALMGLYPDTRLTLIVPGLQDGGGSFGETDSARRIEGLVEVLKQVGVPDDRISVEAAASTTEGTEAPFVMLSGGLFVLP